MATENIVLIEAIKKVHAEKTQDFNRFLKMVDFYGYSGTNKSLSDFFKLVINEPTKFKDVERVVRKWKSSNTIKNMYCSLLKIYKVPAVKDLFDSGGNYELIIKEITDFWKQAEKEAEQPVGAETTPSIDESEIVIIDKSQADLNSLRMRLSMYCDILDEIGANNNPGIIAVTKMMRYDIGNI